MGERVYMHEVAGKLKELDRLKAENAQLKSYYDDLSEAHQSQSRALLDETERAEKAERERDEVRRKAGLDMLDSCGQHYDDCRCDLSTNEELERELAEARKATDDVVSWVDELRDRIRDIYLGTDASAMNRDDVAGHEIASAEKECRLRHEPTVRPAAARTDGDEEKAGE